MRGVTVPDPGEDFTADPVELFFDLSYVFAFAQLVFFLAHHPTWADAGRTLLLFSLIWLTWTQFTWSANAVSGNARPVRLWFLAATVAAVPMGASASGAWGPAGLSFAVSQVVILGMGLLTMIVGLPRDSATRPAIIRYAIPNVVAMVVLLVGVAFEGGARVAIWGLAFLPIFYAMYRAGDVEEAQWIVRPGHFAERHGLILIVALGEVVVASGLGVADLVGELGDELEVVPTASFVALGAAAVLAALLWFAYFDRAQALFEHRAEEIDGTLRGRFARDVWSLWHLPIVAGVIATAAALEEITLHPTDPVPLAFRLLLAGGLVLFLGGTVGAIGRAAGVFVVERMAGLVVLVALVLAAGGLDGVVLAGVLDVVLLGLLVLETRHPRHVHEPAPVG